MHLKSITLKGFKSFPDRTRLEFGPGVSVVVGPNGSGKSNITDAVLWALGEQSPLAVRGQSMQDVIFGGARGQQARRSAEVELVLDNSDATIGVEWSEISILRRLDRGGEGEYRLNGARCRLVDVIEVLSDTGLGKEMHSVVSQGRVEAVVSSKPRDRRLLIEEAAGLGKHRKRCRRAQLKLERTQDNLDRALDVEREARSRLRPLKRQAEAAELHARLERQSVEARWELARDDVRARRAALAEAESAAAQARERRDEVDGALGNVAARREAAEQALAQRGERREALSQRRFAARSATERVELRMEQARATTAALERRAAIARERLKALEGGGSGGESAQADAARLAGLEAELSALDEQLRAQHGARLAERLEVEPGYEAAVAAALGDLLGAPVVGDRATAGELLDRAGADGGTALVAGEADGAAAAPAGERPTASAEPLAERVTGPAAPLARALLANAWVVKSLDEVPGDFHGIAVTRAGRAWHGAARELRQVRAREAGGPAAWLAQRRSGAPDEGPAAVRRARLETALEAERRLAQRDERARAEREDQIAAARARIVADEALVPAAKALAEALAAASAAIGERAGALEAELDSDRAGGEEVAAELRACAAEEGELQSQLRAHGEAVTVAEVGAQQARDQAAEAEAELGELAGRLELAAEPAEAPLEIEEREALAQRIERLARRREQLGPVNPLAEREYEQARDYVDELERQRRDLDTAMRELQTLISETDQRIREAFETTFEAAAKNFEEVVGQLFPGGRGRLRLVREEGGPRPVLGGQPLAEREPPDAEGEGEEASENARDPEEDELGVEIEMTPAGKSMKRLTLLSGGEKSLTALAFLFAIFLARPCPFYVLDEVEAALDDLNIDRFLTLLRRYSGGSQFIVVTHQKRTMEAADTLYGVSMGDDGVSKVISRRLPREEASATEVA